MRDWLKQTWLRVRWMANRKQLNRELDDELAFHLAKREEANRAEGMDTEQARYAARRMHKCIFHSRRFATKPCPPWRNPSRWWCAPKEEVRAV